MELFTLDRNFQKQNEIDVFESAIWTERYYGDGDFQLVVPSTSDMLTYLTKGTFLGLVGSSEIMMIDTQNNEGGSLTVTGLSLEQFLNNRFIRATAAPEDQYWTLTGVPGWILWAIVYYMCVEGVNYPAGIPNPSQFVIPGLGLKSYDMSGSDTTVAVPYGPVYDALKTIGTTYQIGMSITLDAVFNVGYSLGFRSYRGLDRTTRQSVNSQVRFSPIMDSFTNIKELQSISSLKTQAYSFAPSNPDGLATSPGSAMISGNTAHTGFDLRAVMTFENDITTDMVGGDANTLLSLLNQRAATALQNNAAVNMVDGEVVPTSQFKYGVDYTMGDIIEVQGNSGVVNNARITEYIRSQDPSGERAYPTVTFTE
jgi:hypothetical protein